MIPLAEARAELLSACPVLPVVEVPVDQALGCVCGADVVSPRAVPPFACSSVDGYAVRALDVADAGTDHPVELTVLGSVPAGSTASAPVGPGTTWKVMTGAPVPEGADTVVMVELTSATRGQPAATAGELVEVRSAVPAGTGVRGAGSNIAAGDVLLPAGTALGPPHLAVLASAGLRSVAVHRRPRVAVLVTGDELVTEDRELRPGEIYESNGAMVLALVAGAGCDAVGLGVAGDDAEALAEVLRSAAGSYDAVVTTGGVSMGDADPVKAALERLGRLHALQVGIRPAKPFAYGLLDGQDRPVPVLGLPGNPVSSLVSFELLARPALRAMAGHVRVERVQVTAVADERMVAVGTDGRTNYLRVTGRFAEDGRLHVAPVAAQDSHQLAASAGADGLAVLGPGTTVEVGADVPVHSLHWDV